MTHLFKNVKLFKALQIPVRYKNPPHHWSVLRKKKPSTKKALEHFDDFYANVYKDSWETIRGALLIQKHKYIAVVNNFSDTERICEELENLGALNMKKIYEVTKSNMEDRLAKKKAAEFQEEVRELDNTLGSMIIEKQQETTVYPDPSDDHRYDSEAIQNKDENNSFKPVQLHSIETNETVLEDSDRIIRPSIGSTAAQLYEYVPATKLKGMDDYVTESEHYGYYSKGADFSIRVENEYKLNFPDNLLLYTFEAGNFTKFPKPKIGTTELLDYFVLDGASIFPMLSLDLQPGDSLLDMCAAPGGKTMLALQTLYPYLVVANDIKLSRINRINDFVQEFLLEGHYDKKFFVTQSDARYIEDSDLYNKILVDVPCTTDRHVLHEDDNNIFKGTRIKERLRLPEYQSEILVNALKLVKVGGTVVYSTCSLSPIQNDGVVQMSLKKAFEEHNVVHIVKDQTHALTPLKILYNFGKCGLKYGHIVTPSKRRNWGPMYWCKMIRIQ